MLILCDSVLINDNQKGKLAVLCSKQKSKCRSLIMENNIRF